MEDSDGRDSGEGTPACATCGEPIVPGPDHRVITWVDDDDDRVHHRHFCGPDCLGAWDG